MALNITTYRMPAGVLPKIQKQSLAVLEQELERVGADGDFLATAKEQITLRANIKFKYVRYDNGQLVCKIKPGDNSTAWLWLVTPPSGEDGDRLGRRLAGEPDDQELLAAAIPANFDPAAAPVADEFEEAPPPEPRSPDPEPEEEPPAEAPAEGSIAERYAAVKKAAQPYKDRLAKIESMRTEVLQMMDAIEKKEAEIKALEIASEKDATGKDAFEKLHRIEQLLEL